MIWWGLLAGALSVSASVQVRVEPAQCAWAATIPQSLDRLDTLTVTPTASVAVFVVVRPAGLELELLEAGRSLTRRKLPADGACEARADGVALVVEQQLRALGYVPPAPPPPVRTATVAAAPPPPAVPTATVAEAPPPAPEPAPEPSPGGLEAGGPGWSLWAGLGGLLQLPGSISARGGGRLEVAARRGRFAGVLVLSGLAPSRGDVVLDDATRGTVSVWALAATIGGEACFDRSFGSLCGGLRLGAERAQGSSSGELLFQERSQARWAPLFVAGARYRYQFGARFALWLTGEGVVRPSPIAFSVEDGRVVEDPGLAFAAALGGSVRFF